MDLPIVVPLTRPIVLADQTFDALSFDEPDLDTQIAYAELEATLPEPEKIEQADGTIAEMHTAITAAKVNRFWLARLAGVSEQVVGKIKGSDLDAVNAAAEAVMGIAADEGDGGAAGNATPAK